VKIYIHLPSFSFQVDPEYPVDEMISISEFPLSAAAALARLCTAFENHLGIL